MTMQLMWKLTATRKPRGLIPLMLKAYATIE